MDNPRQILLSEINQFLEKRGMPPTVFGWEAIRDPNFVRSLRDGREPRFSTVERVLDFIKAHEESVT
jgi:hypothetical protein